MTSLNCKLLEAQVPDRAAPFEVREECGCRSSREPRGVDIPARCDTDRNALGKMPPFEGSLRGTLFRIVYTQPVLSQMNHLSCLMWARFLSHTWMTSVEFGPLVAISPLGPQTHLTSRKQSGRTHWSTAPVESVNRH